MSRRKQTWPRIRPRRNNLGEVTSYTVDQGYQKANGRGAVRVRFSFKTLVEAEGKAEELRIARKNEGISAIAIPTHERAEAERALELLRPHKVSLVQAAEFYLANLNVIRSPKLVAEVIDELLKVKEEDGRSKAYLDDLGCRLGTFKSEFGSRSIPDVTASELDDWLRKLNGGLVNRNNYRRLLSVLFGFAVRRRYALRNPLKEVDIATVKVTKPGILSVDEARALIESAGPDFVPAIALGLFAGLRPEAEIWCLDWSQIDLEERVIDIQKSKNVASHRFVRISDNLLAWLSPHAKRKGPLTLKEEPFYRRMRETRAVATAKLEAAKLPADNLRNWPNDCLRHTYASCHYAGFKNAGDTAEQLGHGGDLRMFFRHYRNRIKEAEALSFWQILPPS